MKYLKKFDQFSVNYQSYIYNGENEYKSIVGALSSLLIYILSSLYLIQQIYRWQTNQFLPTIVQTNQISNKLIYNQNEIEIDFDPYRILNFDVFDVNKTIFLTNITAYCNNGDCEQQSQTQSFEQIMKNNTYIIKKLNLSTQMSNNRINEYFIKFDFCGEKHELNNQVKCASNLQIDEYFNNYSLIQIKITFSQYNVLTKSMQSYKKSYWLKLYKTKSYYTQINLIAGLTSVDEGMILSTQTNHDYIASADINFQEVYNEIFPLVLDVYLDKLYFIQDIQYPMIGQVLANAGSIVSLLFWFSYLVQKFNQIQLKKFLVNEIIGFYYPEHKSIIIKRKWYNKKKVKVYSKDGSIEYEPEKLLKIYQNASKIAIEKLSILNIIYELSRIQFILQSLQERQCIQQSRDIGIQLPLKVTQKQNLKIIPDQPKNKFQSKNTINIQNLQQKVQQIDPELENIQIHQQDLISQKSKNILSEQDQSQCNTQYDQKLLLRFIGQEKQSRNDKCEYKFRSK